MSTVDTLVSSEPMPPARMREKHLALLAEADDADLPPGEEGRQRVLDFVAAAADSGSLLEEPGERRTAQGILDYWVASLNNTPNNADKAEGNAGGPVVARLAPFDGQALEALQARLQAIYDGRAREDQALLLAMLMALFEADDRRRQFRAVARGQKEWLALSGGDLPTGAERAAALAAALMEQGIVLPTPAPGKAEARLEIATSALLRHWPPLEQLAKRRLTLREGAQRWSEHGKADLSFFGPGRSDPYAGAAIVLDPVERQYLEQRLKTYRQRLVAAVVAAGVVLIALGGAAYWMYVAQKAKGELEAKAAAVVIAEKQAAAAMADEKRARAEEAAAAANAAKEAESAKAQEQIARSEVIRQAIELRDVDVLRAAGINAPDDLFNKPSKPAAADPAPQAPSASPIDVNDVCRGAIYVGTGPESDFLNPSLPFDSPDWSGGTFVTTSSLNLRRGTPTAQGQPPAIGVIRRGTIVRAEGSPVPDRTKTVRPYFIPITAPGPSCVVVYLQYAGARDKTAALADQLKAEGYTVPGLEEIGTAKGLSEVRYYFPDDERSARNLAARVKALINREITVNPNLGWKGTKPPPGTVELWIDLSTAAAKP